MLGGNAVLIRWQRTRGVSLDSATFILLCAGGLCQRILPLRWY